MAEMLLDGMFTAKDHRTAMRARLQEAFPGTCVALALNVAKVENDGPHSRALFRFAEQRLLTLLAGIASHVVYGNAGPYAVLSVADDPVTATHAACRLEAEKNYCRLLDIAVYDASGAAVPLPSSGACLVCSEPAATCLRDQRHSPAEQSAAAERLFIAFQADQTRNLSDEAAHYAALGLEAMLHEVASSPSPGLVDPLHSGSHTDMDFFTFQRSSAALSFGLARCVEAGLRHTGDAATLLTVLRCVGKEAEAAMFRATGGVNTQKGLLFSMGLTLGATGLLLRDKNSVTPQALCTVLRHMTAGIVAREFSGEPRTAGERMYRDFGISGIRGEIEAGLPSVLNAGLPTLQAALARGEHCNRALIRALLALMAEVDDTTVLARSPRLESLHTVQKKARELILSGLVEQDSWQAALWRLDAELVSRNISPGGSADLLALTWYMHRISELC